MTDIATIRARMRDLTEQARRTLALHDAGAIGALEHAAEAPESRALQRSLLLPCCARAINKLHPESRADRAAAVTATRP